MFQHYKVYVYKLRGGRPIYTLTRVEDAGKALARCNYCAHQQSIKARRMPSHRNNCTTFANEVGMSYTIYEYDFMFFCKLNNIIALNVLSLDF